MNLVDYINAVPALGRRILYLIADITDILNAVIRSGINLNHIERRRRGYLTAHAAFTARTSVNRALTVHRFGEYLGNTCFSCTSCTAEQICMSDSSRRYLVFQSLYNVILAFDLVK